MIKVVKRKRLQIGNRRGQALVESVLVLLLFSATLIGTLDFGQLLFTHQSMVERVRNALRWAVVNPYDGSGDQIANMILYNKPTSSDGSGFMGMTRSNVQVIYTAGTAGNPNDERLRVLIVNYQFHFFSPWITKSFTNNQAVVETAAMVYKP